MLQCVLGMPCHGPVLPCYGPHCPCPAMGPNCPCIHQACPVFHDKYRYFVHSLNITHSCMNMIKSGDYDSNYDSFVVYDKKQ